MKKSLLIIFFMLFSINFALAANYKIDKTHSSIAFVATHLLMSKVAGVFENYDIDFKMVKVNLIDAMNTKKNNGENYEYKNI